MIDAFLKSAHSLRELLSKYEQNLWNTHRLSHVAAKIDSLQPTWPIIRFIDQNGLFWFFLHELPIFDQDDPFLDLNNLFFIQMTFFDFSAYMVNFSFFNLNESFFTKITYLWMFRPKWPIFDFRPKWPFFNLYPPFLDFSSSQEPNSSFSKTNVI